MSSFNRTLTRRAMLARSVAATAIASLPIGSLLAAPESRGFKIGACDWSLAAQFRAGGFTVGVASGGASPSGAAALKERLRAVLEDEPADGNARS